MTTTKPKMNVPMTRPFIGPEEPEAVRKVLESGWLIQGAKVEEFEEMGRKIVGTRFARACSSCTTALHMSLLACGVGPGDKVLVPAYTFVATANAVEFCGATPVLCDIDLFTFNINVGDAERRMRREVGLCRAIIPVHLFGLCADMTKVRKLAVEYGMYVVEDAACALGSTCTAGDAGGIGDTGCFSFHPRKSVTTGEGGLVTTNDEAVAKKIHALRDFGFSITNLERHKSGATLMPKVEVLGYNYRLTDVCAAVGVEQLKKWDRILAGKQRVAAIYDHEFTNLEWLRTPVAPEGYGHTYQSFAVIVGGYGYTWRQDYIDYWGETRNRFMAHLKDAGVANRQGTHAVHTLDYYAKRYNYAPTDFINTYAADKMALTIPLFPQMTEDEIAYVVERVKEFKP